MRAWYILWGLVEVVMGRECVEHRLIRLDHVVDGDTVSVWLPGLPAPLDGRPVSLRVRGVDCPERKGHSRCAQEAAQAERAAELTAGFLGGRTDTTLRLCGWDKYGGRVLGDLVHPEGYGLYATALSFTERGYVPVRSLVGFRPVCALRRGRTQDGLVRTSPRRGL